MFIQSLANAIVLSLIYSLVALGLTLIYGMANILFITHGAMYMLAAYAGYFLVMGLGMNYFLSLLIVLTGFAVLGMILERIFFRSIRYLGPACIAVSLGLNYTIEGMANQFFGVVGRGIKPVFGGQFPLTATVAMSYDRIMLIVVSLLALLGLYLFLHKTKPGYAMRASVQDRMAAGLMGVDADKIVMLTFAIGVALAALAGILVAPVLYITPGMGMATILQAFLITGLGGLGSILGCIIAAFIIGFTDAFASAYLGPEVSMGIVFGMLILLLGIRPQGIMGGEMRL